jgi:hypothetical protein
MTRSCFALLALVAWLSPAAGACAAEPENPLASPEALVRTALGRMGGTDPFKKAGGVTVEASGTFDLSARLQGRNPEKPEPTPISEKISVDLAGKRLAYRLDWFNYQHSNQKLMELFDPQGRVLFADLRNGTGFWSAHPVVPDQAQRYRRLVPHLLLADALAHAKTLKFEKTTRVDGTKRRGVAWTTAAGDRVSLWFDLRTHDFEGARFRFDMPVLGDTDMTWWWSGFKAGPDGLRLPERLEVRLDGKKLKSMTLTIRPGADAADFTAPESVNTPEPPEPEPYKAPAPASAAAPNVRNLSNGLHLVMNLRPGFHVPFVEFIDFVAVIDAPSIWYEMQHLPPMNWSAGDSSVALGEKLLKAIRQTTKKPVKYLVLTHHHTDHIGGLRPLLDAGAAIITGPQTAKVAHRAAAASLTLTGYKGKPLKAAKIHVLTNEGLITDGERNLRLFPLPKDNPQAEDFLVIYLPESKTLYATAFLYPVPESIFLLKESVDASKWFIRWLDASGLEVENHLNLHGQARVQDWQVEKIRELIRAEGG